MKIRQIALHHVRLKKEREEHLNFGIRPEKFRLQRILNQPVREEFKIKFKDKLQAAQIKIRSLTPRERECIRVFDFQDMSRPIIRSVSPGRNSNIEKSVSRIAIVGVNGNQESMMELVPRRVSDINQKTTMINKFYATPNNHSRRSSLNVAKHIGDVPELRFQNF